MTSLISRTVRLASGVRSFLFWPVLLLAAALHAGVVLSPAIVESMELDEAYAARTESLARLEEQAAQLRRMEQALATDKGFRSRVALSQTGIPAPEGQVQISLSDDLRFDPQEGGAVAAAAPAERPHPWYESIARDLGERGPLRNRCVGGAMLLCLVAFVFLPVRQEA